MLSIMKSSKPSGPGHSGDTATKRAGGSRPNTGRTRAPSGGCLPEFSKMTKGRSKSSDCWLLPRCALSDTRRFVPKPIHMTLAGKRTLRNGLMCRWSGRSKENAGSSISGKNREVSVRSASRRSPRLPDGIAITSSGDRRGDQIRWKTGSYSILPVTNKFTAKVYLLRSRVR